MVLLLLCINEFTNFSFFQYSPLMRVHVQFHIGHTGHAGHRPDSTGQYRTVSDSIRHTGQYIEHTGQYRTHWTVSDTPDLLDPAALTSPFTTR